MIRMEIGMSAEVVVRFCAPTMAGLKVANLFTHKYASKEELEHHIAYYNQLLNAKGLYFEVLRYENGLALIYVYRKRKLREILKNREAREILLQYGYDEYEIEATLMVLKEHLQQSEFPHEIGVFLGYPLADVKAFIRNNGRGHKCIGCWKVYTNVEEAKATFGKYDKCYKIYQEQLDQGTELTKLTVLG